MAEEEDKNGGEGQPNKGVRKPTNERCAACKRQRSKCGTHCMMAPYFTAERMEVFEVFGVSNVSKILKKLNDEPQRGLAAKSIMWEASEWERDPILGPLGAYERLRAEKESVDTQVKEGMKQIELLKKELEQRDQQIVFFKAQQQLEEQQQVPKPAGQDQNNQTIVIKCPDLNQIPAGNGSCSSSSSTSSSTDHHHNKIARCDDGGRAAVNVTVGEASGTKNLTEVQEAAGGQEKDHQEQEGLAANQFPPSSSPSPPVQGQQDLGAADAHGQSLEGL